MNRTWIFAWLVCVFTLVGDPVTAVGQDIGGQNRTNLYRVDGRFIELTTDLESREEAETLVASFDAAVPQWTGFWDLADDRVAGWKVTAFVMRDKQAFASQGLIPIRVPDFPYGYALNDSVWIMAQPSQYYTRHLMLHEGAHSLAFHCFGGAGPTWFMEGTAELLSTHSGQGQQTKSIGIPNDKADVPYWGRFTKMSQVRAESTIPSIGKVMQYPPTLSGDVESYTFSWAAASMFAAYPEYRDVFREAANRGRETSLTFNRQFRQRLAKDWPIVQARWRLLTHDFDFGFDWDQQQVAISIQDPLWDGKPIKFTVEADRGWQSPGVRVPSGVKVRVRASGQVTLAQEPKPWISEPEGVTIQYVVGRPLGQLIACVLPNQTPRQDELPTIDVQTIGNQSVVDVAAHSWLLFKVNDAVGDLGDNGGSFEVTIEP
ncbi:hypothetical protein [Rubripirellula reticaptiva]|uniref:hypothetical protein n=1 Tax=Rubripirellula reticaptiva TaxID=2528013 RepID=UPI0011B5D629|nr:hypothetical protein [Rubripirellula reticaptiva]